jgi:hypothetical protein
MMGLNRTGTRSDLPHFKEFRALSPNDFLFPKPRLVNKLRIRVAVLVTRFDVTNRPGPSVITDRNNVITRVYWTQRQEFVKLVNIGGPVQTRPAEDGSLR